MTTITFLLNTFLLKRKKKIQQQSVAGFTLVELITVVIMVGVLAASGGAGYLEWLNRLRVNAAQDVMLNAIRDAQLTAKQRNAPWQVSFRETTIGGKNVIQWAVHYADTNPSVWNKIEQDGIEIDAANTNITTNNNPSGAWKVVFNHQGKVRDPNEVGRLITISNLNGRNKRCLFVASILGAVRADRNDNCKK
ncbi:MAG: type II secretion system GspH family protein [Oscillatoriaceae bacterium SKW80]|nr:type II secretion system GspH family protein [Oscillatoriaceae bacterium SKYG93]MCX8121202.1 type II secretion system GspH family protein [Oscillatoriaceae bacterium SKW80]MDW8453468.1 type II secretion system protein [Oscillatoriaceae cyanobacterium SKYGB_i_bin93]HIK26818.1 type II secretion system protein [Oscillatoriaceae cyanobacterium M7585_C2015_266]